MTVQVAYIGPDSYPTSSSTLRQMVQAMFPLEGILTSGGTAGIVTPSATAGGLAADISPFRANLIGDLANQGSYFVWSDAIEVVPWPAADVTNGRWDTLVLTVADTEFAGLGGSQGPAWAVLQGTPAGSPTILSDAAIALLMTDAGTYRRWANVLVPANASVLTGGANMVQAIPEVPRPGQVVAILRQTTQLTMAVSGTSYPMAWQTEDLDILNGHASNATTYIPTIPGRYKVEGGVGFTNNATGHRNVSMYFNGVVKDGSQAQSPVSGASSSTIMPMRPTIFSCNGTTDSIEIQVVQTSGGSLTTNVTGAQMSSLIITYVGP